MVDPSRSWPSLEDGWPTVPFLYCTRDVVVRDLARQPATASAAEARDMSYVWEARRHYMRPSDKLTSWEVVKRIVRSSTGLQEVSEWTLWRGQPPLKQKKRRPKHSPRTKMMVVHLDGLASYQGTARYEWPSGGSSGGSWVITVRTEPWEERQGRSQISQAQLLEKKEWQYTCRLVRTNSLKKGALWYVDPLLGNNCEISNCTMAITRQWPINSNRGTFFFLCSPWQYVSSRTS
jgi:hypothetical protein